MINAGYQYATSGEINWGEVGMCTAVGILGGLVGHFFRMAHYLTKTPLHMKAWSQGGGSFGTYFKKCMDLGSGGYAPFWRSALTSVGGMFAFSLLYNMYIQEYIDHIDE